VIKRDLDVWLFASVENSKYFPISDIVEITFIDINSFARLRVDYDQISQFFKITMATITTTRTIESFSSFTSTEERPSFGAVANESSAKRNIEVKSVLNSRKRRKLETTISPPLSDTCSFVSRQKLPFKSLYCAIRDQSWDEVRQILQRKDAVSYLRYGGGAMVIACNRNAPLDIIEELHKISENQVTKKSANGWLPLHWATRWSSVEVVDFLLKVSPPECTTTKELKGMTPLHLSITENCDPLIITRLLLENPKALKIKDKSGRAPLEQFFKKWKLHLQRKHCKKQYDHSLAKMFTKDSIRAIIHVLAYGKLDQLKSDKWLPLHEAIRLRHLIHPIFIKPLISEFPEEVRRKDPKNHNLPLHIAASQGNVISGYWTQVLLQEYPEAARVHNKDMRLPFNLMVESGNEWKNDEVWKKLMDAAPEAICEKDKKNMLYPFMAACASKETSLNVAYKLLKLDPTQICGGIPLKYAK